MRRVAPIIVLLALALPGAAHAQRPPLDATLQTCQRGPDEADRVAEFEGSMPSISGTRRMWMRFDLQGRTPPSEAFVPVRVTGLGVWQKSRPGRSGFIFSQRVERLAAPGEFRAVVRFRWYGRGGRLLRSARLQTATCRQPDQRPDLRGGALDVVRGPQPGSATYSLVVRNDGRGPAAPFDAVLTANGTPQPAQRLGGMPGDARQTVTVIGPACEPGSTVRFVLDAQSEVEERGEANNTVERACPLVQPGSAARASRALRSRL